jgi:hypothetical protein
VGTRDWAGAAEATSKSSNKGNALLIIDVSFLAMGKLV